MDKAMLLINLISMIAAVVSCIKSIKAKNEAKRILTKIETISINTGTQRVEGNDIENKGDIDIANSGINDGIIGGNVSGGNK